MPRATRKRRQLNPHRSTLRFVEQPRSGSRHDYGQQLRSAINPRSFISEQSRHGDPVHSWVSPQFTLLEDTAITCNGQRKKKAQRQLTSNSLSRTTNSTRVTSTASKYPTLLFTSNNLQVTSDSVSRACRGGLGKDSTVADSPETRPPQNQSDGTFAPVRQDETPKLSLNTPGAEVTPKHSTFTARKPPSSFTPHTTNIVPSPHMHTPEMPRRERAASSCIPSLLFSPNQSRTPPRTEKVLVRDTPESDYGLRVTWRRRKKLMRLLAARGQLLGRDQRSFT